jgi:hypothetical protein
VRGTASAAAKLLSERLRAASMSLERHAPERHKNFKNAFHWPSSAHTHGTRASLCRPNFFRLAGGGERMNKVKVFLSPSPGFFWDSGSWAAKILPQRTAVTRILRDFNHIPPFADRRGWVDFRPRYCPPRRFENGFYRTEERTSRA